MLLQFLVSILLHCSIMQFIFNYLCS